MIMQSPILLIATIFIAFLICILNHETEIIARRQIEREKSTSFSFLCFVHSLTADALRTDPPRFNVAVRRSNALTKRCRPKLYRALFEAIFLKCLRPWGGLLFLAVLFLSLLLAVLPFCSFASGRGKCLKYLRH